MARLRVRRDAADDAAAPARRSVQLEAELAQVWRLGISFFERASIDGERNLILEAGRFLAGDAPGADRMDLVVETAAD